MEHPAPPLSSRAAVGAAGVAFVILLALLPEWPAGLYYDDGIYLVLGQSLALGEGLRYLNLPGEPSATHFPPLYPTLLSMLWLLTDSVESVSTLARLVNAGLYAAFTGLLTVVLCRLTRIPPPVAAVTAVLTVLAAPLVAVALLALSEPLFLLLLLPGLWTAERARHPGAGPRVALAAGLVGGLAWLTRSAALPLLAAAAVVYLAERRWRTLVGYLLGAAPLVLGWQIWVTLADSTVPAALGPNYGSYASWYSGTATLSPAELVWHTAALNLRRIPESLGALMVPAQLAALALPAGLALLTLALAGAFQVRQRFPVSALALLGYLGLILIWPFNPARFMHTLWPLLVPLVLVAATAGSAHRWRGAAGARAALVAALAVGYLATQGTAFSSGTWNLPHRQAAARLVPTLLWVQEQTEPNALIATGLDPAVYLYTGRKAIPPSTWSSSDYVEPIHASILAHRIEAMVKAFHPDYLIIQHRQNQLQVGLEELLARHPGRFNLVGTFEDGTRIVTPLHPPAP